MGVGGVYLKTAGCSGQVRPSELQRSGKLDSVLSSDCIRVSNIGRLGKDYLCIQLPGEQA